MNFSHQFPLPRALLDLSAPSIPHHSCPCSAILCPCPRLSVLCPRVNNLSALFCSDLPWFFILFYFILFWFDCNQCYFHAKPPIFFLTISIWLVFENNNNSIRIIYENDKKNDTHVDIPTIVI